MLGDCSCAEYCARSVAISAGFERLNAKWERQHHGRFINNGKLLAFRGWNKKSTRCCILGNFRTIYGCLFKYYLLFLAHRPPKMKCCFNSWRQATIDMFLQSFAGIAMLSQLTQRTQVTEGFRNSNGGHWFVPFCLQVWFDVSDQSGRSWRGGVPRDTQLHKALEMCDPLLQAHPTTSCWSHGPDQVC